MILFFGQKWEKKNVLVKNIFCLPSLARSFLACSLSILGHLEATLRHQACNTTACHDMSNAVRNRSRQNTPRTTRCICVAATSFVFHLRGKTKTFVTSSYPPEVTSFNVG